MTEITSTPATVTLHHKDGLLEAVTIYNGHPMMFTIKEMDRKDHDAFFEVNKAQITN
jgi:hypothetical protein